MRDIDTPDEGLNLHAVPENTLEQNLTGEPLTGKLCECGLEKGRCDLTCEVIAPTEGL
jgi:hypothetical protein